MNRDYHNVANDANVTGGSIAAGSRSLGGAPRAGKPEEDKNKEKGSSSTRRASWG